VRQTRPGILSLWGHLENFWVGSGSHRSPMEAEAEAGAEGAKKRITRES